MPLSDPILELAQQESSLSAKTPLPNMPTPPTQTKSSPKLEQDYGRADKLEPLPMSKLTYSPPEVKTGSIPPSSLSKVEREPLPKSQLSQITPPKPESAPKLSTVQQPQISTQPSQLSNKTPIPGPQENPLSAAIAKLTKALGKEEQPPAKISGPTIYNPFRK